MMPLFVFKDMPERRFRSGTAAAQKENHERYKALRRFYDIIYLNIFYIGKKK